MSQWKYKGTRELWDVSERDDIPLKISTANLIGCLCWEA